MLQKIYIHCSNYMQFILTVFTLLLTQTQRFISQRSFRENNETSVGVDGRRSD